MTDDFTQYQMLLLTTDLSLGIAEKRLAVHTAEVQVEVERLAVKQLADRIRASITNDFDAFSNKERLVRIAMDSLATAQSQVEVAELRFERGLGSSFDVVESQAQLQTSEQRVISAQIDLIMSYYRMLYRLHLLTIERLVE